MRVATAWAAAIAQLEKSEGSVLASEDFEWMGCINSKCHGDLHGRNPTIIFPNITLVCSQQMVYGRVTSGTMYLPYGYCNATELFILTAAAQTGS
jgi:hypothetical protein